MIEQLSAWLGSLIHHHVWWAIVFLTAIAFGESLALVGAIIPATPFFILVGTSLGLGELDPITLIPPAILGAFLGYQISFSAGRVIGRHTHRHHLLTRHRRTVARMRLFSYRWGASSLIVGRFVLGPVQSLLPLVVGGLGMSRMRFTIVNIVSSIVWILVVLAPGYLSARGLLRIPGFERYAPLILGGLVVVSLAAALAVVILSLWRGISGRYSRNGARAERGPY